MSASEWWRSFSCFASIFLCLTISARVEAIDRIEAETGVEVMDEEKCLMCHKYPYMGRIDENGRRHNYNINAHIYAESLHNDIACNDCHTYITKLPHDPVTQDVNCATICHIQPPFTQENFSHQKLVNIFDNSAHGVGPEAPAELKKAQPDCKYCHINPVYEKMDEDTVDYEVALARCRNCHQQKGVTEAYVHITHRLRSKTSRSPQEIVALCSSCHADKEMLQKIGAPEEILDAVETYKRSIHGKFVALGSQMAADCISCHASNLLHDIYKEEVAKATINEDNLAQTCRQCHEQTNSWFVQIAVHPEVEREENPVVYFAGILFRIMLYGAVFSLIGLMLLETYGRKSRGIKFLLRNGTSWRGESRVKEPRNN